MCHTNYFLKKQPNKTKSHIFRYLQAKNIASKSCFCWETKLILSYSEQRDIQRCREEPNDTLAKVKHFSYIHFTSFLSIQLQSYSSVITLLKPSSPSWHDLVLGLTMRYKNMGYVWLPLWSLEIRESQQGKKCVLKPVNTPWKNNWRRGEKGFYWNSKGMEFASKKKFCFKKNHLSNKTLLPLGCFGRWHGLSEQMSTCSTSDLFNSSPASKGAGEEVKLLHRLPLL